MRKTKNRKNEKKKLDLTSSLHEYRGETRYINLQTNQNRELPTWCFFKLMTIRKMGWGRFINSVGAIQFNCAIVHGKQPQIVCNCMGVALFQFNFIYRTGSQ